MKPPGTPIAERKLVIFRAGDDLFASDIARVERVLRYAAPNPVPNMPDWVAGVMEHRGRVLSRDRLLSDVWDYQYPGETRTVDVHVRRLREKLPYLEQALVTVQQFGYKLMEP